MINEDRFVGRKLYSYVVDHDHGFAPNPESEFCTLVHCKFGGEFGRSSIVEQAKVGDWILGTGGVGPSSCGSGKLLYLMRVDEKLHFIDYLNDDRFVGRLDRIDQGHNNLYALVSSHFYYFGERAIDLSLLPEQLQIRELFKSGQGYRCDLTTNLISELCQWFEQRFSIGKHGEPCDPLNVFDQDDCLSKCEPSANMCNKC